VPRLTVRAAAEMLRLPAPEQMRILYAQKYPSKEPQAFRAPYYAPALNGIRAHYQYLGDPAALAEARVRIAGLGLPARRDHNLRVLRRFEETGQSRRRLHPKPRPQLSANLGGVELRLSTDLRALEGEKEKLLYYNCRSVALEEQVALSTLEIAHWLLGEVGQPFPLGSVEFIDLHRGRVVKLGRRTGRPMRLLRDNVRFIEAVWDGL